MNTREISKDEFSVERVKTFYKVRVINKANKKVEDGILVHLPNRLLSISLESNEGKFEIKKKVRKSNVVALKDNSSIYIWESEGLRIDKIKIPINPLESSSLQSAYEPSENIKLLKSTTIGRDEYLFWVDQK